MRTSERRGGSTGLGFGGAHFDLRTARVARLSADRLEAQLSADIIGPTETFLALRSQLEHLASGPDVTGPALLDLPQVVGAF